jgi:hypothetical protein
MKGEKRKSFFLEKNSPFAKKIKKIKKGRRHPPS